MRKDNKQMLHGLADLRDSPQEQAIFANSLLRPQNGMEVVQAALGVLARIPHPPARNALRDLYWHYSDHNGTRDPAAYTRTAVLKALRPIAGMDDSDVVVDAVTTYEFLPPSFSEESAMLRGTAIVILAELDTRLSTFFATRLLADGYTEQMSGEPALTAVRVLASYGEILPLYFYVVEQREGRHPEVIAESLRNLCDLPGPVVGELIKQISESEDRASLVGLFDLLIAGPDAPRHPEFISEYLQRTNDEDLYRYSLTIMVTSPSEAVHRLVGSAVEHERNANKVAILRDVYALAPPGSQIADILSGFV